jgi:hypothetical protein
VSISYPGYTVTFNANGGTVSTVSANTGAEGNLASLPIPTRGKHSFAGWFTAASGGTRITTSTVFNADTTIYAHWNYTGGGDSYSPSVENKPKTVVTVPVEASATSDSEGNAMITVTQDKAQRNSRCCTETRRRKGHYREWNCG